MGGNERTAEINKEYGWNLVLKNISKNPMEMEKIVELDFGTVITWMELSKAQEELEYIYSERLKNKIRSK